MKQVKREATEYSVVSQFSALSSKALNPQFGRSSDLLPTPLDLPMRLWRRTVVFFLRAAVLKAADIFRELTAAGLFRTLT